MKLLVLCLAVAAAAALPAKPQAKGIITDVATSLQQVIDGIDHVLHPDTAVTKRDLVDIAHQIEGIIGEISKVLGPTTKRSLLGDISSSITGILGTIDQILHPLTRSLPSVTSLTSLTRLRASLEKS